MSRMSESIVAGFVFAGLVVGSLVRTASAQDVTVSERSSSEAVREAEAPVEDDEYAAVRYAFSEVLRERGINEIRMKGPYRHCLETRLFLAPGAKEKNSSLNRLAMDAAIIGAAIASGAGDERGRDELAAFESEMLEALKQDRKKFDITYGSNLREFARSLASLEIGKPESSESDERTYVAECMAREPEGAGQTAAGMGGMFSGLLGSRRGGDLDTKIQLSSFPAGASIKLISRWNKLVCDGRRINAFDFDACEGWTEFAAGSVVRVNGDYHYHVTWPDGGSKSGRFSVGQMGQRLELLLTPAGPVLR